ncbi:MAG: hypothetical protein GEV03_19900 [Streptosporangiales bacterium]|nr:hypothetical protein [Streptosporangiales bacterium]
MAGITYDTGALIAAESNRRDLWTLHDRALANAIRPTVPSVVLAQAWRGGPQPNLSRLLRGCVIEAFDENGARAAGRMCGLSRTQDFVDATVVIGALARNDLVVTSDPNDLQHIANVLDVRLAVHVV